MTDIILSSEQISALLENKDGELRIDSRIVASGFGLKSHKDYRYQILEKYETQFEELGGVLKTPLPNGEIVWWLNQAQVNFAGTLARNTEKAVKFKLNLVKAFEVAKRLIPVSQPPKLPSRQLAVETAEAIDKIQAILSRNNPRLAQVLIDCAMNDVVECTAPQLPANEFPDDRWYGLVQIADKMNIKTNHSTRAKLGQHFTRLINAGKLDVERVREERLCNGQWEPIWCYRDNEVVRGAIQQWADSNR